MKKESGKAVMPKEEHEKKQCSLGRESKMKYTEGMDNAAHLDKNLEGLASYMKKNKAKH